MSEVPQKLEKDGTTVSIGDPNATVTVHLYEDPRCPVCEEFELTGGGPVLRNWVLQRKAKAEYTLASFLDDRLGGNGSKRAVNALRAALEVGKFAEYHAVLYAHQPDELNDGFTEARLLELASLVDGLRSPSFDTAVKGMRHQDFITRSQQQYQQAGTYEGRPGPGTPAVDINGRRVPDEDFEAIFDEEGFASLLSMAEPAS
ncbi:thioredoxin domain-containing protein [Streptosporangium sp. NPDC000239]|uniref:thioredoxin domain-containing protein n=1 Tax=Streptosporangium sp. NPDC000239 TaxID=3154248 RepID=UPI0033272B64